LTPHTVYVTPDQFNVILLLSLCVKDVCRACPIAGRVTLFKHRHLSTPVMDEQLWKGFEVVMNDNKGGMKLPIGVEPNNPKENNSLTGRTKITVFNHRHER
jgi:hypothetical protein